MDETDGILAEEPDMERLALLMPLAQRLVDLRIAAAKERERSERATPPKRVKRVPPARPAASMIKNDDDAVVVPPAPRDRLVGMFEDAERSRKERERREELEAAAPRAALACTTATAAMTPSQRRDAIEARAVAAELAAQKAERQAAARDRAARVDAARTQRALAVVHRGRALARAGLRGLAVAVAASARRAHEAERYRLLALLRGWHRAAAQEAEDDTVNVGAFTRHRRARAGLLGLWRAAALARHADDVLARRAFLGLAEAAGDARDRLTAARGHHERRASRSALRAWGAHASEEASARRVVEAAGEAAVLRLRRVHALRRGLRGWVEGAALEAETRVENRRREERWGRLDGWLQEIRSGGSEKGATVAATKAADRLMLDFDAALGPVPHPEDLARGEGGR